MERNSVVAIVKSLNDHDVRYLVVGGLAVVTHGYVRFTADVDLMLSMVTPNLERAVSAFSSLGYVPRAPVDLEGFLDPALREQWAREKNMTVFSLFSNAHRATEIDLFLEPPIDFEPAFERAYRAEVAPGVTATFCSVKDLIAMKSLADRPRDREDIENLKRLGGGSDD